MVKNSSKQSDTEKKRVRRIIYILAIIIFILLIITSCNSEFFGRIGSLFHSSSNHTIGDNDKTTLIIMDKSLSFDSKEVSLYLNDKNAKLTFKTNNIKPSALTCTTDDAKIATCYIDKDYVVIKPQTVGETNVYLYTDTNGVTYKTKALVKVLEDTKGLILGATKGTINLHYGNGRSIPYNLNGISGTVKASSSNPDVATVKVKNGRIVVTGHKTGSAIITVKVKDGNKEYTSEYKVVITDYEITTKVKTTTTKKKKTTTTSTTTTTKKTDPAKSYDNSLKKLEVSTGTLSPSFNKNTLIYGVTVSDTTTNISINAKENNNKATIMYYYKGVEVNNLNNLNLEYGNNEANIVVTAEDGSQKTYKVIINRPKSKDADLKKLEVSTGSLNPSFHANNTSYTVNVSEDTTTISVSATKKDSKATITYEYKGESRSNLNDLNLEYGNNVAKVLVTAEDGTRKDYYITINRKMSDNAFLKKIETNKGTLSPLFNKNTNDYTIEVENNISDISLNVEKDHDKASVTYKFKGETVTDLNDLSLDYGDNLVEVLVTAQDGTTNTYKVNVKRKKSDNAYLSNLSIENKTLTPTFNKNTYTYSVNTKYSDTSYNLSYTKDNSNSTVIVKHNNAVVSDISNITLVNGDNTITVEVTAQDGITIKTYTINIHKPVRTISTNLDTYVINLDTASMPYGIDYVVKEDDVEIDNYELDEININIVSDFTGTLVKNKGYISLSNLNSCKGKTYTLTIKSGNSQKDVIVKVITNNYFISTYATNYDLIKSSTNNSRSIIINNNIITGTPNISAITGGIRIKKDDNHYIDVVSSNPSLISVSYDNNDSLNSLVVKASTTSTTGSAVLTIKGYAFDSQVDDTMEVTVTIKNKFDVTINANGGLFANITGEYKYELEAGTIINLSDYVGLKEDNKEECKFFTQKGFSTNKDATDVEYENSGTITVNDNIVIYSIYEPTSGIKNVPSSGTVYLTDVDIFHNEDYMTKYNVDKMIYPGAHGSHEMTIKNTGTGPIKIINFRLEEDTVCISENNCLNMAYTIEQIPDLNNPISSSISYGSMNILNKDNNTVYSTILGSTGELSNYHTTRTIPITGIEIPVNTEAGFIIYWKWLSVDDNLDTKIGSQNTDIDYTLTVSLDYERTDIHCDL